MLSVEGKPVMVERVQASLTEIGFHDVHVTSWDHETLIFSHLPHGRSEDARRAVWKAAAVIFPQTYVCWGCFESNSRSNVRRHCSTCSCCCH